MDAPSRPLAVAPVIILAGTLAGTITSWSMAMWYASVSGVTINSLGHAVYAGIGVVAGLIVGITGVLVGAASPRPEVRAWMPLIVVPLAAGVALAAYLFLSMTVLFVAGDSLYN